MCSAAALPPFAPLPHHSPPLPHPSSLPSTIYTDSAVGTAEERAKTRDEILEAVKPGTKQPLVIFPEGTCNNCDVAIMQYQKFVFGLGVPVVPVALKIRNPWPIEFLVTFGPIEGNLATFLFMPLVV